MLVIAAAGIYHLVGAATAGLGPDESYFFSLLGRLQLSYFDHPPLSVWLAAGSMALFGPHAWALRLPTVLMFAGTTWLIYVTGRRAFGLAGGMWAAILLNLSALFMLAHGMLLLPDGAMLMFSAAAVYLLTRLLFDPPRRGLTGLWALAGGAMGLALLSKYQAAFIPVMTLAFLLARRDYRRHLASPGPYLAAGVAAALFLPVIIWNVQHGWASFVFQGSRATQWRGLQFAHFGTSILGQAGYILPWLWGPLVWQLFVGLRGKDDRRLFFSLLAAGPILALTAVALISHKAQLPHWQALGYLILFVPLGASTAGWLQAGNRHARRWLIISAVSSVVGIAAASLHITLNLFRHVIPAAQWQMLTRGANTSLGMADYDQLATRLDELGLARRERLFVFSVRWLTAGKVDWALRGRLPVLCLDPSDPRGYAFLQDSRDFVGWDAILVAAAPVRDAKMEMEPHFGRITPIGSVHGTMGGLPEEELLLFYCENYHTPVATPYR